MADSSTSPSPLDPYRKAVKEFGASFESTLWLSKEKQVGRFEVIAGMVPLHGRVVVDAGAGIGDLAQWMHDAGIVYGRYVGLEGVGEMVAKGNERDLPEFSMVESDFGRDTGVFARHAPDVVVFSGSLNTFDEDAARAVIRRAWDAASEAVVFNFLSTRNGVKNAPDPSPARRFDPVRMVDWALSLTTKVVFRQDYFEGHDGTVGVFK